MLFALITAGSGLSSVLVINQAALAALTPAQGPAYQIVAKPGQTITMAHYGRLRQQGVIDGIAVAHREVRIKQQVIDVYGVDAWPLLNNRLQLGGEYGSLNKVGTGRAWISHSAANKLKLTPGATLTLPDDKQTPPLAISEAALNPLPGLSDNALVLPITDYFALFADDVVQPLQAIFVLSKRSPSELQQLKAQLPAELILQATTLPIDSQTMGKSFSFHLVAMAGLLTVVSLFIVTNALSMLLAFRRQTIGHLHKLGVAKKSITQALCIELSLYCVVGSLVGVLLGFWLITYFATGISTNLTNLLRAPFSLSSISFLSVGLLCLFLCAVGMAVAVVLPLRQALQTEPKSQASKAGVITGARARVMTSVVALIMAAAIIILLLKSKTKEADLAALALFILLGSLVVTAALPGLLATLVNPFTLRWPLLHWALASASGLSRRCKLAASSYFIALVSAVGLSGMVDSFRTATDQWLQQRLAAPAYVYTEAPTQVPSTDNIRVQTRRIAHGKINGVAMEITELPTTEHYQQSMVFAQSTNDVWRGFTQGNGLLLNQQFAYRNGIGIEDQLTLAINGNTRPMRVLGIYKDFGNPNGQGIVAPSVLTATGPGATTLADVVALHPVRPVADWQPYKTLLANTLSDASFITKQELIDVSMAVFDQTFVLTDGLTVVALIVAAFSFAITIALLSQHLKSNIQTLSAIGINFRSIRRAVFSQFIVICLLVSLLAIPFGIGLAYLLITTVNINAFGWTYPLNISPVKLLAIVGAGFVGLLLVCWLAIQRSTSHRLPPGYSALAVAGLLIISTFLVGCSQEDRAPIFGGFNQAPTDYVYKTVDKANAINLPADHAPHNEYQLEWWYLTSVLRDEQQRTYPFQYTVFRFNQNGKQTYMAHASLHSPDNHWFEQRFAEPGLPYFKSETQPFLLSLDNWQWQGAQSGEPFPAQLTIPFWQGPKVSVSLQPTGPYVLQGEGGVSVKSADANHVSYYYSQPFLSATVQVQNESSADGTTLGTAPVSTTKLTGNAWYDHEWTSQLVSEQVNGWDWFSIHLNNGDKIMAFRLRIHQKADFITGNYIQSNGVRQPLNQNQMSLQPANQNAVPLEWQLAIPSRNLSLTISPIKQQQWNCGLFTYYEGGVNVAGTHAGEGFMELTGYPHGDEGC
ncbi:lipocalin-like domain-containing protein [Halioxenophilus aromaticivorans]